MEKEEEIEETNKEYEERYGQKRLKPIIRNRTGKKWSGMKDTIL